MLERVMIYYVNTDASKQKGQTMPDRKTLAYIVIVAALGGLAGGLFGVIQHYPPVATVLLSILASLYATVLHCFTMDLDDTN